MDEELIYTGAYWWREQCDFLIVEGAGGVLSPISDALCCLDVATTLRLPILLVAANRLGMVNHTLLSVEAISRRGLEVVAIVMNDLVQHPGNTGPNDHARATNWELLQQFCSVPLLADAADWQPEN